MKYTLNKQDKTVNGKLPLVSSKSESNRILIIKAISKLPIEIKNLSGSKDTDTLFKILSKAEQQTADEAEQIYNVGPAGTTMRFLTAFLACTPGNYLLTGSERMKQRPIRPLVDALKKLGADISYVETEGNPPIKIHGKILRGGEIEMDGSVSSQFISAMMMIGPALERGLILNLKNGSVSKSYVKMTAGLMQQYGVNVELKDNTIIVPSGGYKILQEKDKEYFVEADWSSASYLYAIAALSDTVEIEIEGLRKNSLQADAVCAEIFNSFGVQTEFLPDGIRLKKTETRVPSEFNYDFQNCPDIAQTLAVVCAAKKIKAKLSGLKTLHIKETDRITALQKELSKFNVRTETESDDTLKIFPAEADFSGSGITIETYEDHRMAMSFTPLALVCKNLAIENPFVVEKSWPDFWNDIKKFGFTINEVK